MNNKNNYRKIIQQNTRLDMTKYRTKAAPFVKPKPEKFPYDKHGKEV